MKILYTSDNFKNIRLFTRQLKLIAVVAGFLLPCPLQSQISGVSLTSYQACGGVTIIPFCTYSIQRATNVTIYYERMVTASVWQLEGTQVYNHNTSYIIYNGNDLISATNFRVRAIDGITGTEYVSNSVSVDPATWNVPAALPQSIPTAYWGVSCGTNPGTTNYIEVQNYYSVSYARPPFTIAYKRSFESNYSYRNAGETTNSLQITGIVPFDEYDIRITDYCGKQSFTTAKLSLQATTTVVQGQNPCSDGQVTINPAIDTRYSGIAPYTFALIPDKENSNNLQFTNSNIFNNLKTGTYKYYVRDTCENEYSNTVDIGGGTPSGTATEEIASDSCFRTITIHPDAGRGTQNLTYALRAFTDRAFTYQTDSVFTVSQAFIGNTYLYQIINACGDTSLTKELRVTSNNPQVDSVTYLGNTCVTKDFVVHVSGGNAPYQYGFYSNTAFRDVYQYSDTIRDLPNGPDENQYIKVKDRCGRIVGVFLRSPCSLFAETGEYESKNNLQGCPDLRGNDWIDVKDNYGKLVYSINPNGNTMDSVCWGVHVEEISNNLRSDTINGMPTYFLDRNFYIEPRADLTLTDSVSMRIYFTDAEMQHLLGVLYYNYGLALYSPKDLKILKKKGSPGSPVDLKVTNDAIALAGQFTTIYPSVFKYGNNWVLEFKVKDFSEFNPYIGELKLLPLNFMSFGANLQKDEVQLQWTTANELNTKSFDVQWSMDGLVFTNIGTVPATSFSGSSRYTFNHATPANGTNYYRLKQTDKNGQYTFSKTVAILFSKKVIVKLIPNPVHNTLNFQMPLGSNFKTLKVFDASGRLVLESSVLASTFQQSIDVHTLSSGWYMLQLDGDMPQRVTFIKH